MGEYELDPEVAAVRSNDWAIAPLILNRWSPRSFLEKPVEDEDLMAVLDAAHWAPSCFNEQPWRFIVARRPEDLERMRSVLAAKNRQWADRAPVLIAVISSPRFALDHTPNRWHEFDSGTAWGYLALEASRRGLTAHGMGGFSVKALREKFGVPEDWGVHAVVALGYRGPSEQLAAENRQSEHPSQRKPLHELWAEGRFGF